MTVSLAEMQTAKAPELRAHYDAAKTTSENAAHWAYSSAMSADRINSRDVRSKLRNRARYELSNNTYASGITSFIANEVVGSDIHLMLRGEGIPPDDARWLEGEVHDWMAAINAVHKLTLLTFSRVGDGESFGVLSTSSDTGVPVELDLHTYECDYVQSMPWDGMFNDSRNIDGVILNDRGYPVEYRFMRHHPGGNFAAAMDKYRAIPASQVLHMFNPTRPGQHRGVSELAAALPLFAMLRRYTLAVLAAAETAADFAGILYSAGNDVETREAAKAFERVEIERRALMTLPEGYDLKQFKAEQPTSTYAEFKRELIAEIARSLSVPVGVALGDHSGFNYSSAKLDGQLWQKTRRAQRNLLRSQALDRLLRSWHQEAALIPGYLPQSVREYASLAHDWRQSGDQFADPQKEANGQQTKLESGTTNLSIECAREGHDWEEVLMQRGRELRLMRELGMAPPASVGSGPDEGEEDDDA
jgi:lambda family phage portal protein